MGKSGVAVAFSLLGLTIGLPAGCSPFPGSRVSLVPEGNRLEKTAESLRNSVPQPLSVPRELDKHPLPPYTVEPGDVLVVQPADIDSPVHFPGDQPVLPDGSIHLGRYGQLVVAGMTIEHLEAAVHALVRTQVKDAGPINVRVVNRPSKVYYVLGDVNAPGAFPLNGRETVLDGLVAAGGLCERASRRNIILSRPTRPGDCRVVLPVNYQSIVQLGDTTTNYQLAPGDRIFVPTRNCWEDLFHPASDQPFCCSQPMPVGVPSTDAPTKGAMLPRPRHALGTD
jgi:protein involved in polysaccharide export with SLBB domain